MEEYDKTLAWLTLPGFAKEALSKEFHVAAEVCAMDPTNERAQAVRNMLDKYFDGKTLISWGNEFEVGEIVQFTENTYGGSVTSKGKVIGKYSNGYGIERDDQLFIVTPANIKHIAMQWLPSDGQRVWYLTRSLKVRNLVFRKPLWNILDPRLKGIEYFRTKNQASEAARRVKAVLEAYRREIDETGE